MGWGRLRTIPLQTLQYECEAVGHSIYPVSGWDTEGPWATSILGVWASRTVRPQNIRLGISRLIMSF